MTSSSFILHIITLAHHTPLPIYLNMFSAFLFLLFHLDIVFSHKLYISYTYHNKVMLNKYFLLQSFEEARLAINAVNPLMLVTDESSYARYSKLQQNDVPSLKWHILLDSPSSDFTKWNGMNIIHHCKNYTRNLFFPLNDSCNSLLLLLCSVNC